MQGRFDEVLADAPAAGGVRRLVLSRTGRYREAVRHIEEGRRNLSKDDHAGLTAMWLYDAWLKLERGGCGGIAPSIASADREAGFVADSRRRSLLVIADVLAGTCDAQSGRLTEARGRLAHARQIHASGAPTERWWVAALEGEIALAAGDPAAADRAFADLPELAEARAHTS